MWLRSFYYYVEYIYDVLQHTNQGAQETTTGQLRMHGGRARRWHLLIELQPRVCVLAGSPGQVGSAAAASFMSQVPEISQSLLLEPSCGDADASAASDACPASSTPDTRSTTAMAIRVCTFSMDGWYVYLYLGKQKIYISAKKDNVLWKVFYCLVQDGLKYKWNVNFIGGGCLIYERMRTDLGSWLAYLGKTLCFILSIRFSGSQK